MQEDTLIRRMISSQATLPDDTRSAPGTGLRHAIRFDYSGFTMLYRLPKARSAPSLAGLLPIRADRPITISISGTAAPILRRCRLMVDAAIFDMLPWRRPISRRFLGRRPRQPKKQAMRFRRRLRFISPRRISFDGYA